MAPRAGANVVGTRNTSLFSKDILRQIKIDKTEVPLGNDEAFERWTNELKRYQYANDSFNEILTPLTNLYSHGIFDDLTTQFTTEVYRQLGINIESQRDIRNLDLDNIKYDFSTFEKYINTFHNTLDGLSKSTLQNFTLNELRDEKEECDNILKNPENLVQYFRLHYTGVGLTDLDAIISTTKQPILRPEYAVYIDRHGLPVNGMFDSDKMSVILMELNIYNQMNSLLL